MRPQTVRAKVLQLRAQGKTYSEINRLLKTNIPKSTLATWSRVTDLPSDYHSKIQKLNKINLVKARIAAVKANAEKQKIFFKKLHQENSELFEFFKKDYNIRKIVLATLYLAEGSKTQRGALMFGNSDPLIVQMFVNLMRECYKIDEAKFRCTVQCRAGQDISVLERFWSKTTKIPSNQFYGARVDKRTIGQPVRKLNYKGVCRIDYFSSAIDLELKYIAQVMIGGV